MHSWLEVQPLPFPEAFRDLASLKLILGLGLFLAGLLLFSIWRDRFSSLRDEEKTRFLFFHPYGGSWLLAIFAICGGIYFLFDSIFRFHA